MNALDAPERYEILHLIGRGGMGYVFCARDTRLQRNVALKLRRVTSIQQDDDESERTASVTRMIREARAAAALEHPNIVTVYDVGELPIGGEGKEPSFFIAMELIEGKPLREYIGRRDVDVPTRVRWLADVARALAFAHDRGVIHRDIKPDNVMVRNDGVAKVLDFGLARRVAGVAPHAESAALPTLTEQGSVLGTLLYMAPEQMCGVELDGRADQFSWGVIAYELLAGKLPWPGAPDSIQVVAQVLTHEPVSIFALEPTLDPDLGRIVHRAIARNKEDRFASMDAVLDALEEVFPSQGIARTSRPQGGPVGQTDPANEGVAPRLRSARGPGASTSAPAAPARPGVGWRGRAVVVVAALGAMAVLGGALIGRMRDRPRASPGACTADVDCGAGRTCQVGRCVAARSCRSNVECTRTSREPAVCRQETGTCAVLSSADCHIVAEPGDVENDATVWFGAMFPLLGDEAQAFGKREFQAVDLARYDFARMLRGLNTRSDAKGAHPLAIVACDDSQDASRAARHLVDDVGVPAVIGFRTSSEVIDLATSIFIPRGVLAVAALNTSPIIASLPRAPGQPRMVFRTTYSSAQAAAPIGRLVSDVLEPEIRAETSDRRGRDPLRVALVRQDDAAGIGFADALFRALRYNGRSALENESNYAEITYPFDTGGGEKADFGRIARKLSAFAPHIVIHFGADEALVHVLEPLERGWKRDAFRPRYVKPSALGPALLSFIGQSAERRRRFLSITSSSATSTNARFVARYSETYAEKVTRTFSPNSSYDAFYLLAYATHALGHEPVTGVALAQAIGRLLPPGLPIDVGPSGIFDALNALSTTGHIDLNGATGRLDFDMNTGEAPVDLAVLCVKADADGNATESVESGLTYDAKAGALRGERHCP
jgi:ABC-type branched-subunit amino acid transport system substrate-binding protein/tRNA A-37 threonylcarbamoyl transferase component Bud32